MKLLLCGPNRPTPTNTDDLEGACFVVRPSRTTHINCHVEAAKSTSKSPLSCTNFHPCIGPYLSVFTYIYPPLLLCIHNPILTCTYLSIPTRTTPYPYHYYSCFWCLFFPISHLDLTRKRDSVGQSEGVLIPGALAARPVVCLILSKPLGVKLPWI